MVVAVVVVVIKVIMISLVVVTEVEVPPLILRTVAHKRKTKIQYVCLVDSGKFAAKLAQRPVPPSPAQTKRVTSPICYEYLLTRLRKFPP